MRLLCIPSLYSHTSENGIELQAFEMCTAWVVGWDPKREKKSTGSGVWCWY